MEEKQLWFAMRDQHRGLYFVFEWNAGHDTRFFRWLTHVSLATQVGNTRWWRIIQLFVDKNKRK